MTLDEYRNLKIGTIVYVPYFPSDYENFHSDDAMRVDSYDENTEIDTNNIYGDLCDDPKNPKFFDYHIVKCKVLHKEDDFRGQKNVFVIHVELTDESINYLPHFQRMGDGQELFSYENIFLTEDEAKLKFISYLQEEYDKFIEVYNKRNKMFDRIKKNYQI